MLGSNIGKLVSLMVSFWGVSMGDDTRTWRKRDLTAFPLAPRDGNKVLGESKVD